MSEPSEMPQKGIILHCTAVMHTLFEYMGVKAVTISITDARSSMGGWSK
jgi:hypothetical protein